MEQDFHFWLKEKYKIMHNNSMNTTKNHSNFSQISKKTRESLLEIEEIKRKCGL